MTKLRRRGLVAGLGVGLVLAVGVMVAAARSGEVSESSPLRPGGGWETALVVAGIAAVLCYVLALVVLRRGGSLRVVGTVALVVQLAGLFGPVLLSRDVYAYWAYGRLGAVHGANPYADVPADFPADPGTQRMGSTWLHTPSLYGPVFTGASESIAAAVDESPRRAELAFRTLAALSVVAILACAGLLASRAAFAVAFVGWNPLLALHFGGGGHNDAPMMALALGGLLLARRGHPVASGMAWAAAIGVKWVALAFVGLVLLRQRFRDRDLLLGLGAGIAVIAAAAFVRYGTAWLHAAAGVSDQARRTGSIGLSGWLADLGLTHRASLAVIGLATLLVVAFLAREAWQGRIRLGLAGVLLAAVQGWLNPWYAIWGVALAATEEDRTAQVLAVLLSAFLLRDALPL